VLLDDEEALQRHQIRQQQEQKRQEHQHDDGIAAINEQQLSAVGHDLFKEFLMSTVHIDPRDEIPSVPEPTYPGWISPKFMLLSNLTRTFELVLWDESPVYVATIPKNFVKHPWLGSITTAFPLFNIQVLFIVLCL